MRDLAEVVHHPERVEAGLPRRRRRSPAGAVRISLGATRPGEGRDVEAEPQADGRARAGVAARREPAATDGARSRTTVRASRTASNPSPRELGRVTPPAPAAGRQHLGRHRLVTRAGCGAGTPRQACRSPRPRTCNRWRRGPGPASARRSLGSSPSVSTTVVSRRPDAPGDDLLEQRERVGAGGQVVRRPSPTTARSASLDTIWSGREVRRRPGRLARAATARRAPRGTATAVAGPGCRVRGRPPAGEATGAYAPAR